jgi:hypothetical protein
MGMGGNLALAGEGLGLHAVQEGVLRGELPQPLDELVVLASLTTGAPRR